MAEIEELFAAHLRFRDGCGAADDMWDPYIIVVNNWLLSCGKQPLCTEERLIVMDILVSFEDHAHNDDYEFRHTDFGKPSVAYSVVCASAVSAILRARELWLNLRVRG